MQKLDILKFELEQLKLGVYIVADKKMAICQ